MQSKPKNIDALDSLRAFAALSVCLFHFVCKTTGFIQNEFILQLFSVGKFGVQSFFVISGFIIPFAMYNAGYKIKNFLAFLFKRISRLEPPYLFSIALALLVLFIREKYLGKTNNHVDISAKQVFLHLGYLIPFFEGFKWLNQVYWTLAIEFQYYILIGFLFVPLVSAKIIGRIFIYVSVILVSFLGNGEFLPHWLPIFLLGILLFLFMSNLIDKKEFYLVIGSVLIFCFFRYSFVSVLYSLLPIVVLIKFSDKKIIGLDYLGKFSYSIYLIHPIIGASFINILSHSIHHPYVKVLVIMGGLIITLIGSLITYRFIEKPSKRFSASLKYKK